MKAMVLESAQRELGLRELPQPRPEADELLIAVEACAVCRTDLHIVDGDLKKPKLPLIIGHEIVGTVREIGAECTGFTIGDRVGVPWLGKTCGHCRQCQAGRENLCEQAEFTGYTRDGGYAEYTVANHRYCFMIPKPFTPAAAAPLLCAGLIGWRSYKMAGSFKSLGLYGFGAAAHIIAQVAIHERKSVYAFTRSGDKAGQEFARELGCVWSGGSDEEPPEKLDAAIIFAPIGALVPAALKVVTPGGTVVCGGIHMSDIPSFPYQDLWMERKIVSVANLTREDAMEFLQLAPLVPVRTAVTQYKLEEANQAIADLRAGTINGAAVLVVDG